MADSGFWLALAAGWALVSTALVGQAAFRRGVTSGLVLSEAARIWRWWLDVFWPMTDFIKQAGGAVYLLSRARNDSGSGQGYAPANRTFPIRGANTRS